jgi:galacturan 1,4-alpha-galacturonidase
MSSDTLLLIITDCKRWTDSSVENVQVSDVNIVPNNGGIRNGAYIKTWIGSLALQTAAGGVPRGGGVVRNVLFSNFNLHGPSDGTAIAQNSGNNGSAYLPSKMQVSNVAFVNFTGSLSSTSKHYNRRGVLSYSSVFQYRLRECAVVAWE